MSMDDGVSPDVIEECMEIIGAELLTGRMEPAEIPLTVTSADTEFLNALEHEIYGEAPTTADAIERAWIRCEHSALRLTRHLAEDNAAVVASLCQLTLPWSAPLNARLQRLWDALLTRSAILPADVSRTIQ